MKTERKGRRHAVQSSPCCIHVVKKLWDLLLRPTILQFFRQVTLVVLYTHLLSVYYTFFNTQFQFFCLFSFVFSFIFLYQWICVMLLYLKILFTSHLKWTLEQLEVKKKMIGKWRTITFNIITYKNRGIIMCSSAIPLLPSLPSG